MANRRTAIALLLVAGFAACISSPQPAIQAQTNPRLVARAAKSSLTLGDSTTATATPYDALGRRATGSSISWRGTGLMIRPESGSKGQRVTIIGSAPGATIAVASWKRADGSVLADSFGVTVTAPVNIAALYFDDFSKYTSTTDLAARFWKAPNHDIGAWFGPIDYDTLEHAMRYDFPARPTASCGSETKRGPAPRMNPPPTGMRDLWVRFTTKESPNFSHGLPQCGGRSYKFFLISFENDQTSGRVGTYLFDGPSGPASTRLYVDMNDRLGLQQATPAPVDIGGDQGWGGSYLTWVLELLGIGTPTSSFTVYLDGKKVQTLSGAFLNGQTLGPGWKVMFELGANINSGPDHAQSRWFREFGVYASKPSLAPMVPR
jgi:hypothetical protein